MRIDPEDIIITLEGEWRIIQWEVCAPNVYHDILHCDASIATNRIEIIRRCRCGAEVPDAVRGFLVLCRNRNEEEEV